METNTVIQLKSIAKQRGLHRYSNLRKAELIELLTEEKPILDLPVPKVDFPVLQPTPYKRTIPALRELSQNIVNKVKKKVNEFAEWMLKYVPSKAKIIDESF